MEAGATGAIIQDAAWLVDLESGIVSGSVTHPNLSMVVDRVMKQIKWTLNTAGNRNV